MPSGTPFTIVSNSGLSAAELAQVLALRAFCNAHEALDLKLSIEVQRADEAAAHTQTQFLARDAHGQLTGYCSLDPGHDVELCGMVHPDHRRRGVGSALLKAALAAGRGHFVSRVILICEDASASGRGFVAAHGATLAFSEYRMEMDAPSRPIDESAWPESERLRVESAGPADLEDLVAVQAAAFHDAPNDVRETVTAGLAERDAFYFIARLGGEPVGSLKVYLPGERAGIYAFGVAPHYRRRGFGRQILVRTMSQLRAGGHSRIWLEVDSDNAPALALYRALGFTPTTTYGYYAVSG